MASASLVSGSPASVATVRCPVTLSPAPPSSAAAVIATVGSGNVALGDWVAAATPADVYVLKADSTAADQFTTFFKGANPLPAGIGAPAATWSADVSGGVAGWTISSISQTAGAVYGWMLIH